MHLLQNTFPGKFAGDPFKIWIYVLFIEGHWDGSHISKVKRCWNLKEDQPTQECIRRTKYAKMHVLQNAFYGKFAGEFFQIKIQIQGHSLSAQRFSYKIHPSAKLMLFSFVSFWSKGSPMKIILSFLFATAFAKVRISQTHSNTSQQSKYYVDSGKKYLDAMSYNWCQFIQGRHAA